MLLLALLLPGCDADCDDPTRINGSYAAFHDILNMGAPEDAGKAAAGDAGTAEGYDDVSYAVFANGWSRWDLTWAASTGKLKITAFDSKERMGDPGLVNGQSFTWSGDLVEHPDNCNNFDLAVRGELVTSMGTTHNFKYDATLAWQGSGLAGTYTYTDGFTGEDGSAGALTNAKGDVFLVEQGSEGFDTGF
ncbi:hypothetical protein LBMAG42_38490 [Deltaproteobacteria bacterium]|nr:hypothetical protein LBMAG42_38490 [Deltaproteobacteria bacterium]